MSRLGLLFSVLLLRPVVAVGLDGGGSSETPDRVRLQAAVVIASSQGQDIAKVLKPLTRRLKTLLPYTSYKGFTEYTASLGRGEQLELRLPDGRLVHLTPRAADAAGRPIHVAVERGEELDTQAPCDNVTVFQLKNGTADHPGDRTFLVYTETCPGHHPARLLPETR